MDLSEREIEDWAVANLATVCGHDDTELLGRQLTLPSGRRVDLIATHPELHPFYHRMTVIEIKKGVADEKALCQLLAYMNEVAYLGADKVRGILLAPRFTDLVIRAAPDYRDTTWIECRTINAALSVSVEPSPIGHQVDSWFACGRNPYDNPITDFMQSIPDTTS